MMGPNTLCMIMQGNQSSSTIAKVLANIVAHPAEAKYRKLRLANKRIQETIVDVDGGVELLQVHLPSNVFRSRTVNLRAL